MFVCCKYRVLSGRSLFDELITRPEEFYRLCCVVVCDLETWRIRRPWPALGRSATAKEKKFQYARYVCDNYWVYPPELKLIPSYMFPWERCFIYGVYFVTVPSCFRAGSYLAMS
jgi:hypothetical protein